MEKVIQFIKNRSLIEENDRILVGVSGGADSVYLLRVLCALQEKMNLSIKAIHVNHQIRKEAAGDQEFVETLCARWKVPCKVVSVDVKKIAKKYKLTLEEAGRKARYEIFYKERDALGGGKIAVAHHQNDQAETFLFRIARGTGIEGAGAMKAFDDPLIRPLLCMKKAEIQEELIKAGQDWVEDATNEDNAYARNQIRNQIIPLMEEVNPRTVEHIAFLSEDIQEVMEYLKTVLEKQYHKIVKRDEERRLIDWIDLKKQDLWIQKQIVKRALEETAGRRKDIEKRHVRDVFSLMEKDSGKQISLPYQMVAEKSYQYIILKKKGCEKKQQVQGILRQEKIQDFSNILEKDCIKIIDYDKIENGIQLRYRKPGDFFVFGTEGRKKSLNRFFIDEKIPREMRDQIPLAADGNHIVWIVGRRVSSHYQVSDKTKQYLKLEFIREKGDE
ncbi:tRNA lysidine(34) synthetase TilS [Anaerostipes faecalis]|uniref:tRNA lysidine(34) synthetase TilS n=1 Tax=Anaerostipes faecalis TaxID=2738446 RepID=UPI001C1E4E05|nr:tRNA lysidine(34) synthetase TilS [Anaerostipes faecalis]